MHSEAHCQPECKTGVSFFKSLQMGNNCHSERCVIQEVKRASEQSCVGEIGLQHAFLLSSSGQVFSLVFNVFPNKLFVVGVTGLSRKDRKKYEDWKAQSLGGKVGGKSIL